MTYLGPSLRRARRRSRTWTRALIAVAASLALNAIAIREILGGRFFVRPTSHAPQSVALAPLSPSEWEANRRATPGATPARPGAPRPISPPKPAPPPPPVNPPGQVVDVAPSKDSTPPKDSRFVSDHDSTVEKETRSRHAKPGYANRLAKPSEPKPQAAAPPQPGPREAGEGGKPGSERAGTRRGGPGGVAGPGERPDQAARDRLAMKLDPSGEILREERRRDARGGDAAPSASTPGPDGPGRGQAGAPGKEGPLAHLQLHPSASTYDRLSGGPAPDHLPGVEEGEGTYLNTREWKYAGYFNRIKEAVSSHWDPATPLATRDPTGQRLGYKDWLTVLAVTLDDGGGLKKVTVQKSSGLDFLDRSAEDAFRRAQPFVNPPRGLLDTHGEIAFTFGFYVVGGSGMQIFRMPAPAR